MKNKIKSARHRRVHKALSGASLYSDARRKKIARRLPGHRDYYLSVVAVDVTALCKLPEDAFSVAVQWIAQRRASATINPMPYGVQPPEWLIVPWLKR